jgi:hypothetical protein
VGANWAAIFSNCAALGKFLLAAGFLGVWAEVTMAITKQSARTPKDRVITEPFEEVV